jgi:hypothetical protein
MDDSLQAGMQVDVFDTDPHSGNLHLLLSFAALNVGLLRIRCFSLCRPLASRHVERGDSRRRFPSL